MYRTGIVLWQAFAGPSFGGMEDSGFGCYGLLDVFGSESWNIRSYG